MEEKRYEIRYLPLFRRDLYDTVDYIAEQPQNPGAAEKLMDVVEHAILERACCAEAFEPYNGSKKRTHPYDRIYVKNYTIYYVVIGNVMEVRRLLYNRRDVARFL